MNYTRIIEKSHEQVQLPSLNKDKEKRSFTRQKLSFADNRPSAITQRRLQKVLKNSLQKGQVAPIQHKLADTMEKINSNYLSRFSNRFAPLSQYKTRENVLKVLQDMEEIIRSDDDLLQMLPHILSEKSDLKTSALTAARLEPEPPKRASEVARLEPEPTVVRDEPKAARKKPVPDRAEQEVVREERGAAEHGPGAHNIASLGRGVTYKLIPKALYIKNLFRGDNRSRDKLVDGFKPGRHADGYLDHLKDYLKTRGSIEAEADARAMISRQSGKNIYMKGGIGTDLVMSLEKIKIDNGKTMILLNYVCSGPDTGAGSTSYLIKVEENFTCISASPTIGLYESPSGVKILAVAQSSTSKTETVKFTEYDFLTPVLPDKIYYASNDGGRTQVNNGNFWFRLTDGEPR